MYDKNALPLEAELQYVQQPLLALCDGKGAIACTG